MSLSIPSSIHWVIKKKKEEESKGQDDCLESAVDVLHQGGDLNTWSFLHLVR